ncbi:MAG: 6-bladed beta-propeller [Nitrospirae bacterium]|nr:6-bladed beta-propeller [Nitrospirota bacterium]
MVLRKGFFTAMAFLLASCAGNRVLGPRPLLVWPLPPDPPRIRYVRSLATSADLNDSPTFVERIKQLLVGVRAVPVFTKPFGVCSGKGRIFATDPSEGRVVVFDMEKKKQYFLGQTGAHALARPHGCAVGPKEELYVVDRGLLRAMRYTPEGEFMAAYGGNEMFLNPIDAAVSPDGKRLYVSDSYLHQVLVFDPEGKLVLTIGKQGKEPEPVPPGAHGSDRYWNRGSGEGEFNFPTYLALDKNGLLYVVDAMNFRIQIFDSSGAYVRSIGSLGRGFGNFARPKGIAVDADGNLYVADGAFNNVQIFNAEGQLLMFFGAVGHDPGQFWLPQGVAVEGDRILVVDQYNHRLQVFELVAADAGAKPVDAPANGTSTASKDGPP